MAKEKVWRTRAVATGFLYRDAKRSCRQRREHRANWFQSTGRNKKIGMHATQEHGLLACVWIGSKERRKKITKHGSRHGRREEGWCRLASVADDAACGGYRRSAQWLGRHEERRRRGGQSRYGRGMASKKKQIQAIDQRTTPIYWSEREESRSIDRRKTKRNILRNPQEIKSWRSDHLSRGNVQWYFGGDYD